MYYTPPAVLASASSGATSWQQPALPPRRRPGASIHSGTLFTDTDGQPVHAHGAGVLLPWSHPQGSRGRHYLVGTTQKRNVSGFWLSEGINLYSSFDLERWAFEGRIFSNASITTGLPSAEPPVYRIERPKVLYNRRTRQYVLYFHLDSALFTLGMVGVCTSSRVAGPYSFVGGFRPDGRRSLDLTLFQERDGQAYLVRAVDNRYIGISRLTADYLNTTAQGEISRTEQRAEAPAMWREPGRNGSYYLLVSGLSGWKPNAAVLYRAAPPLENATWQRLGNPSRNGLTFNSQPAAVLPYQPREAPQKRLLIYLGDRWNFGGRGSVSNASYVWLPMVRGQPGQRGCRRCVPGATGYVMPRLTGSAHTVRWQPRPFYMGTAPELQAERKPAGAPSRAASQGRGEGAMPLALRVPRSPTARSLLLTAEPASFAEIYAPAPAASQAVRARAPQRRALARRGGTTLVGGASLASSTSSSC